MHRRMHSGQQKPRQQIDRKASIVSGRHQRPEYFPSPTPQLAAGRGIQGYDFSIPDPRGILEY